MVLFILFFIQFSLAVVDPPKDILDLLMPLHDTCTKEVGISDDDVKGYIITNNDQRMMCYMNCIMTHSNWLNNDGYMKFDYILESVHPKVLPYLKKALLECRHVEKGKECELAYNWNVCYHTIDPDNYFLP